MGKQDNHYVYMLRCKDDTFYTGYTNDLKKRLNLHELGKGAKYTRGRGPFELVYCESFSSKREAMQAEYRVKQLSRQEKEKIVISYLEGQDENVEAK